MRSTVLFAMFGMAVSIIACGEADPYGDMGQMGLSPKTATDKDKAASCGEGGGGGMAGTDPEGLQACTGTKAGSKGRCVPTSMLGDFADTFESADCKGAFVCIPEDLVREGTKIKLTDCNAVLDTPGKCFWPLAKDIAENYDMLKGATKGQCEGDMVCAPCTDPRTGAETGVCKLGEEPAAECSEGGSASKKSEASPKPAAQCPQLDPILEEDMFKQEDCTSNMLCVDASLVGERASLLAKCAKGVCAPKKTVLRGGNYVPKTCKSLAGAEGRCSNIGIPEIGSKKDMLPQGDCDEDERCAPCFDPTDGKDTGACKQASCDAPKEPAKTFAECCGGGGRCVPTESAGKDASSLNADSCSGETPVCAPKPFLPGGVQKTCKSLLGIIKGVCASKCAINKNGFIKKLIESNDCSDEEVCVPRD